MQPVNIQQKLIFKIKKNDRIIKGSVVFYTKRLSIVLWVMKLTKTFYSSMGMISQSAYHAGNFETTGSKFSNETCKSKAACVLILLLRKFIKNHKQTSSRHSSLSHPHHLTMLNHYLYDPLSLNPLDESLSFLHLSKR